MRPTTLKMGWTVLCAALVASCGKDGGTDSPLGECLSDEAFFEREVHARVLQPVCMQCHIREGQARDSGYILETPVRPDFLAVNRTVFSDIAGLERDGKSIVLIKPVGGDSHGGGAVLKEDSEEYAILEEFVSRLGDPVTDCETPDEQYGRGLELIDPVQTLRKAAIVLVGRPPTAEESASVAAGGEAALRAAVRAMTEEDAFVERMIELYNDVLLTDAYLDDNDAIGLVDYERYPGLYWFDQTAEDIRWEMQLETSRTIAREPLNLLAHILREDRPFTELLTADYIMVNDFSATSYGLPDTTFPNLASPSSFELRETKLPGIPHAGLLTTAAYMNRYPTTDTNRNRHRTWAFMKKFLATDILQLAERPIDLTASEVHNPTMNDPQCAVCHAVMDPVAGLHQDWDVEGHYHPPEEGWFTDMREPGFGGLALPPERKGDALAWLAEQVVADTRFGIATVQTVLAGVTGLDLVLYGEAAQDETLNEAWKAQQDFVLDTADKFTEGGHDVKFVVEEVVLSRYFRAKADADASPGDLVLAGTAHLLTPEELNRKLEALTGTEWATWSGDYLTGDYRLLYGGIDSEGVTSRLKDPNGIMNAVSYRMATDVACLGVARDFLLPPQQRRLFPLVEPDWVPQTQEGFDVTEAAEAIRANIVYLHEHLLGERLDPYDPEIEATYTLWYDTWLEGLRGILDGQVDDALPWQCQADDDVGEGMPYEQGLRYDELYTVRAWQAVTTYLLTDYHFLYE